MTVTKVRPGSSGVQTYSTVLNDREGGQVGTALLTHGAGLFYGLITTKDGIYQVQPSSEQPESPHLLQKMRQVSVKGITDFEFPDRQNEWDRLVEYDNGSMQQTLSTNSTVDVLVLFTPTVRARKLGTTPTINWINAMISDYNEKLLELGVTSFTLSLKGALETKWPTFSVPYHENNTHNGPNACFIYKQYYTYCDSIVADQYWLSTNSTVANLRNTYAADVVILIAAETQKHPNDVVHGFAGLKFNYIPKTHGNNSGSLEWGEFVTVRDDFALSNLTFHHEVGHVFGITHSHGEKTFGYTGSPPDHWVEQAGPSGHRPPISIMSVGDAGDSICLWSTNSSSSSCNVRLPFFAHRTKFRKLFYSGWLVPRVLDPKVPNGGYYHKDGAFSGALVVDMPLGADIVSQRR